jgi:hypothetical protein
VQPRRPAGVEDALELDVGTWLDGVGEHRAEAPQRLQHGRGLCERAGEACRDEDDRRAVHRRRQERRGRCLAHHDRGTREVGQVARQRPPSVQHLHGGVERVGDETGEQPGTDLVQSKLERGDDAEVAPPRNPHNSSGSRVWLVEMIHCRP